jgi:galactofuranosylgalactofuranosylrhamnosyl-N-acetylglucosaminyl-diphospho-decaprenol beta-1,5/1,6-galactofuranosyltransferase
MNTLQSVILRDQSLDGLPQDLYTRGDSRSTKYNTYFNLLNLEKIKNTCSIHDLFLRVKASGKFEIIVWESSNLQSEEKKLEILVFNEVIEREVVFPLSSVIKSSEKFIYIEIVSTEVPQIESISYITESPVINNVKLGVVIVHFNRKQWVLPALKRLRVGLLEDPRVADKISIAIVDNSQNITSDEACGFKVIPNENLGGSGGFTRGLIHFKDLGYSHCLFMDDDASCEVESIKRTWALLAYSKDPKLAVAGALFHEDNPSIIYEKGAVFSNQNKALFGGFDMSKLPDLSDTENSNEITNYGGWWFFAFPLKNLLHFPFPFFVRGDDVMFSLRNDFNILTSHGIACWGSDFASKSSPVTCYLDMRSLMMNNVVSKENSIIQALKVISKFFLLHLLSFNYASARAILLSLKHMGENDLYWENNMDLSLIRNQLLNFEVSEVMKPFSLNEHKYAMAPKVNHRGEKGEVVALGLDMYLKALLLNGAVLPDFFLKKEALLVQKGFYGSLKFAFRYKQLIYYHDKSQTGYVASLNRKLLFKLLVSFSVQCLKLIINQGSYQTRLRVAADKYSREDFWREIYNLKRS